MSEFSYPSKKTTPHNFSILLLSDFHLFCSFAISHPLYFSYLIFFSPYLLKLLSFLSPLFITTSLLVLLVLFTVSPDTVSDSSTSHPELSESKASFLLSAYKTIVDKLRSEVENEDHEFYCFEELEVYKIVFETSDPENRENPDEVLEMGDKEDPLASSETQSDKYFDPEGFDGDLGENSVVGDSQSLRGFLNQKQELEDLCKKQEKEVKPLGVESNKVEETSVVSGSNAVGNKIISEAKVNVYNGEDYANSTKLGADLWSTNGDYSSKVIENSEMNLGSSGSMRKEKEWRRTLACKLLEERHNVDGSGGGGGGEGMDMLWETYEANDSTKVQTKSDKKKTSTNGRSIKECCEDEEEEDYDDEQLCCLQALKLSAGKMNLGMGRPNLLKISKAFKGIGWLHHLTKIRKKAYH
ncbi:hypothetical protein HS088_TW22G00255 [Tripterygium wilfordii]|uniref:Uncharacterized protein n=1 Tax=Tripterygium wilfordii TaxID=458696 RepID=A0A7J7BYF0_TRIWF|nr:uncharacterized protein LOC119990977 [Tripterygium wilfordii]KAF5726576.1 hypothetical protein HS088_TW22G00255 [Tripterygium wilfordii]